MIYAIGNAHEFKGQGGPRSVVRLADRRIEAALPCYPGLSIGEGYMNGRIVVEEGSIYDFLDIALGSKIRPEPTVFRRTRQRLSRLIGKIYRYISLLRRGEKVLDIGSGWSGLGIYLAQVGDVDVIGLTLSVEQHDFATRRVRAGDLGDRGRFNVQDYRAFEGGHDRITTTYFAKKEEGLIKVELLRCRFAAK